MKPKLARILAITIAFGALTAATDVLVVTVVAAAVVMAAVVMAEATGEVVMVTSAAGMAVDISGAGTSARVTLPEGVTAVLMSARVTSAEATGLRAGTGSVIEIISVTTPSAADTAGITLPGSAGAAGVAGGVVGGAG
jgi:hypothetical protein